MCTGTAFASTASMDIPAGDMPQMSMSQASMDSDDFNDESSIFLTAPKVTHHIHRSCEQCLWSRVHCLPARTQGVDWHMGRTLDWVLLSVMLYQSLSPKATLPCRWA